LVFCRADERIVQVLAHRSRGGQLGLLNRLGRLVQQRVSQQKDFSNGHFFKLCLNFTQSHGCSK
jgi:hypothetical protein